MIPDMTENDLCKPAIGVSTKLSRCNFFTDSSYIKYLEDKNKRLKAVDEAVQKRMTILNGMLERMQKENMIYIEHKKIDRETIQDLIVEIKKLNKQCNQCNYEL